MNVLITGTAKGIGKAIAVKFLKNGHHVYGLDIRPSSIESNLYSHYICDITDVTAYPDLPDMQIVINNAGVQNSEDDIEVNLVGTIRITEKYAIPSKTLRSVLNIASASAHTGAEFPCDSASKGGIRAYTRNVALRVADRQATCNSISPGGVKTALNLPVMQDKKLWKEIMDLTPLKRWAEPEEIADWAYFLTVTNKFMTGQDVMIDGGESTNAKFVWKEEQK